MTGLRARNYKASEFNDTYTDQGISEPSGSDCTHTPASLQQKAPLPDVEQAVVTYYAYDPQTFEILCRPGQRLSQRKVLRLQELDLYVHVVTLLNNTPSLVSGKKNRIKYTG